MTTHTNPFNPSGRMLRQFAALWIVFFGIAAAVQEFRHARHGLALVLAVLALAVGPTGLALPRVIKPIFVGWMWLAYPIGWVVSRIVLTVIFLGLFTPIAVWFRVIARDVLVLKRPSDIDSYWNVKPTVPDKASYLRQF